MCTQHLTSTPKLCNDTSTAKNSSYCFNYQASLDGNVDGKILQILEGLLNLFDGSGKRSQGIKDQVNECFQNIHITSESRLTGQFSAETIFNLTHRVLTDTEIKILEKRLDFAPIQRKINEPELKQDFKDFCRSTRLECYFWNQRQQFSDTRAFSTKSSRNPLRGHSCLEVFLVRLNTNSFEITKQDLLIPVYVWKSEKL